MEIWLISGYGTWRRTQDPPRASTLKSPSVAVAIAWKACWLRLLILPARGQGYGYCLPARQRLGLQHVVKVKCFAASSSPPTAGFPWNETGCCWLRLLILPARGQGYGYCLPARQRLGPRGTPSSFLTVLLLFLHAMTCHGYGSALRACLTA